MTLAENGVFVFRSEKTAGQAGLTIDIEGVVHFCGEGRNLDSRSLDTCVAAVVWGLTDCIFYVQVQDKIAKMRSVGSLFMWAKLTKGTVQNGAVGIDLTGSRKPVAVFDYIFEMAQG